MGALGSGASQYKFMLEAFRGFSSLTLLAALLALLRSLAGGLLLRHDDYCRLDAVDNEANLNEGAL